MSTSSSTQAVSSDVAELNDMVRALILDRKNQTPASKSMCPRPLRPISTKLILVIDLRWSQTKFDLLVFLPFRILMQIVKTISIEEITSIKTEETISTKVSLPEVVLPFKDRKQSNHDTEVTKDTMPPANNGSTEDVQPPVIAPVVTPIPKVSIPFPSRRNDENRREKANEQIEKFYEIFKHMNFEISFLDAL
ncbi:hypothetical protein Tco_1324167, partial [Tanacetum coccineum]